MIEQKIVELLTALQRAIELNAPTAFKLLVELAAYKARIALALCLAVAVPALMGLRYALKRPLFDVDNEVPTRAFAILVPSAIALVIIIFTLTDNNLWLALFRPDLAVVNDLLKRVIK